MIFLIYILFYAFVILKIYEFIKRKKNYNFDTYFGVPGSGKTVFCAWLAKRYQKKKKHVYSNVPIINCELIEKSDIGTYEMKNGILLLDEAGIDFDNRNFKNNFTYNQVEFFKKHRHNKLDVAVFSQFYNDMDLKLRNLSTRIYIVKKSIFPFCISRRRISKRIGIDELTKQIIDEYYFVPIIGRRIIIAPKVWKMFKTHTPRELPHKDFPICTKL